MKNLPKLYSRTSTGAVQQWQIFWQDDYFWTESGQVGGQITKSKPNYCLPKNEKKKNATTAEQQAEAEALAKWEKKLKQNNFENIDDIDKGWLEPQLAKPCADYIDKVVWEDGQIVDQKLNGFACVTTIKGAVSRKNERYNSIPHILEEVDEITREFPDAFIHGELYNPQYVTALNEIAELIAVTRQPKDIDAALLAKSREKVQFHIYDGYGFGGIKADDNGKARREKLVAFFKALQFKYLRLINFKVCHSFLEMSEYAREYIAQGGEGVIIRNPKALYQHKRTKDLLKFKKQEDAEFTVISVEEGNGNWKGCAKYVWCELPSGLREQKFKVNVEGSQEHLRKVFANRDWYPGKRITARFQEYSPYGVPLIPYTDLVVRDEIEGKI